MNKTCVWLSRHKPTPAQLKTLAGYKIIQRHPPTRYYSAEDALMLTLNANGGCFPDLVVAVMGLSMLQKFVRLVGGRVAVVRAIFDYSCEPPRFVKWQQVDDVCIVARDWTPEVSEVQP